MSTAGIVASPLLAGGENEKSGPIGLVVILLLCVACYFLFKSMSKHLRKVREQFPVDAPAQGGELSVPPPRPALTKPPADGPPAGATAQPAEPPPPSDDRE
ncbi:MAG TPA: hypothetical protein VIM17_08825 [Jatrophihabitantaceae bacterium]